MSNTDRDSLLERWAHGMETLEQYYEGLYGPPGTPATLPSVTTYDGMLEAIADGMERAQRNINKKSPTYHNTDIAYTKTVPSGAQYASLEKLGGKTVVWNQLIDHSRATETVNGITFTNNGDGSWTVSGTASADASKITNTAISTIAGHQYALRGCPSGGSANTYRIILNGVFTGGDTDIGSGVIANCTANNNYGFTTIKVTSGTVISTPITFCPQVTDLTLLSGSGNEPTLAEFQQMFPAQCYAVNQGSLLSADVTSVVSKSADNTTIDTYPIPAEIQALDGYGWSAGSVYNYIDFERKVFVQNVGFVDLSALTFGYGPSVGWSATLPNVKNPADDDTAFNGLSATLKVTDRNTQATAFSGGTDAGMVSVSGGKVYVGTGDINIVPSGTLYFEVATPIETDISQYLTDDYIAVEGGGTLTFENQNGDDYRIPVPSTETFWVG